MSLPYHRGHVDSMTQRNSGYSWGTKGQQADEAARTLLETENDRHWVWTINLLFDLL